jgi:8-oxo-dGTP diphosphatase
MPDRSTSARPTSAARGLTLAVDTVLFAALGGQLAVLLVSDSVGGRARTRWSLPSDSLRAEESLDEAALRIAREVSGSTPAHLEQAIALGGARRQAEGPNIGVTYFGLLPDGASVRKNAEWVLLSELPALLGRQREAVEAALGAMRARVDQQPIAFRLLPTAFTLSELQSVYELLLGRRLHKASFRRSLHASALVEATDEWRSEGRGRPAQLFRYAPPRRKRQRRGIRFDLLSF